MSVRRKKKEGPGPASAAGLMSFYKDVEPKVLIKPPVIIFLTLGFILGILILGLLINPF